MQKIIQREKELLMQTTDLKLLKADLVKEIMEEDKENVISKLFVYLKTKQKDLSEKSFYEDQENYCSFLQGVEDMKAGRVTTVQSDEDLKKLLAI